MLMNLKSFRNFKFSCQWRIIEILCKIYAEISMQMHPANKWNTNFMDPSDLNIFSFSLGRVESIDSQG